MRKYNPKAILDELTSLTKKIIDLFGVDRYTALVTAINLVEESLGIDLSDFRDLLPALNNTARYHSKFDDDGSEEEDDNNYISRLDV